MQVMNGLLRNLLGGAALAALAVLVAPQRGEAQGIMWQTTHHQGWVQTGAVKLVQSSIRVRVTPAYLDVEEEAEIATVGTVSAGGDPNSLEIIGEFSLVPGATVVGMLLWNGDILLKARLKGNALARADYEKVVDRSKVPPPRPLDPALVEALGEDRYRVQIYPVAIGKSRRIRLRYHIPAQMAPSGIMLRLASIFPPQIADRPARISVKWERAAGEEGYVLYTNGRAQGLSLPSTVLMSAADDIFITQAEPPKALVATTYFPEGNLKGFYTAMYFHVPDKIVNYPSLSSAPNFSVMAMIRNGSERYALDINCFNDNRFTCEPLEFHGKSAEGWDPEVEWTLYNGAGRELTKVVSVPEEFTRAGDSTQAALWAGSRLPFAESRERYLGIKYGFVDVSVSLLALEQDTLEQHLVPVYALAGVPRLTQAEIFPPDTNDIFEPNKNPVNGNPGNPNGNPTTSPIRKLGKETATPLARVIARGVPMLSLDLARLAAPVNGKVKVTLIGLDGREVWSSWVQVDGRGPVLLSLPALRDGFYFVKVDGRGLNWSGRILLRK